jgi:hypothetical protein
VEAVSSVRQSRDESGRDSGAVDGTRTNVSKTENDQKNNDTPLTGGAVVEMCTDGLSHKQCSQVWVGLGPNVNTYSLSYHRASLD